MKTNPDGTLLSAETISEIIEARFEEAPFPIMTDVIGSDAISVFPRNSDHFKSLVRQAAARIYDDYCGHLTD